MSDIWLWTIIYILLGTMILTSVRLFLGRTLYDRVLAVNAFGTQTIILLGCWAAITMRADLLDIVLLYALINFVAVIAILKFFRYRNLRIQLLPQQDKTE